MVQALINIDDDINQALNIVKAKHGLKDKSMAIAFVVRKYLDEPELRAEFVTKMQVIEKQKSVAVKDFAKRYGL